MTGDEPDGPQLVRIDDRHAGQRIDNYLLTALKGVPKSHVYRLLRKGQVRVNKGRIKPVYRLKYGDVVRIPPLHMRAEAPPALSAAARWRSRLEAACLYEDEALIVLNKPAGMAVHGGSGLSYGLIELLRQLRPDLPEISLVHRLDRETSGCLLLSKSSRSLLALQQQFMTDTLSKRYLSLLQGHWQQGRQKVDQPLRKNRLQSGERMVSVDETGKSAITFFKPRRLFRDASLLDILLMTGRTHQIRVHAAWLGCPIAGDSKYGNTEFNSLMRTRGLRRLFLHAASIELIQPLTGKKLRIDAPLGDELTAVLAALPE